MFKSRWIVVWLWGLMALLPQAAPAQAQTKSPDFDGDGTVDLGDFFLIGGRFGDE